MANSLDRGLEEALAELESTPPPLPESGSTQTDPVDKVDHFQLRYVEREVRSLRRTLRRQWVAMGLLVFAVAGSVALNLVT